MSRIPNLITGRTAKLPGDLKHQPREPAGERPRGTDAGHLSREQPSDRPRAARVLDFDIPWPPSVNRYWRHVDGRTLVSREGREFRETVVRKMAGSREMLGRLKVSIVAHPPDRRRRDLDNLLKATIDALQHAGLYRDDHQIDRIVIERGDLSSFGGWLAVTILELPEESPDNP